MKKLVGLAATAVLSAGVLTGCGGSGDYCSSLEEAVDEFDTLDDGDFAQFDEALETFRGLADEAPSEVEDQWDSLVGAIDELETAFDDAGVSFEDLDGLESGDLPEGVDQEALMEALGSVGDLGAEELTEAGDDISEHAESECDVEL